MKISFFAALFLIVIFALAPAVRADDTRIYGSFSTDNDITGNDYGYTGQFQVELGFIKPSGFSYGIGFYTANYTQRVIKYGDPSNPSYAVFTGYSTEPANGIPEPKGVQDQRMEQNTLGYLFIADTDCKSWLSWRIDGAITQTESNAGYIPTAAGFQQALHGLIGATKENIISDGKKARYGLMVKPTLMARNHLAGEGALKLELNSKLGLSIDTEGRREYIFGTVGLALTVFQSSAASGSWIKLISSVDPQISADHKQVMAFEGVGVHFGESEISFGASIPITHTGYSDLYNTVYVDDDTIYKLAFQFPL